jgi:hypothetical protein
MQHVQVFARRAPLTRPMLSGSTTMVNNVPTIVYPGLCSPKRWPNCATGTLLAVALPEDYHGDPLLTNWTKPSYNPILNNTQRDPTTAWHVTSGGGEWRMTTYTGTVYTSRDFLRWRDPAAPPIFPTAECPDFFELPPLCTSNGCSSPAPQPSPLPTHVLKQSRQDSSGSKDW